MNVNPMTGEVVESPELMDLVPLNPAAIDENEIAHLIPTPAQVQGALALARTKNAQAPAALDEYRRRLQKAERKLTVAVAMEVKALRADFPRATMSELKGLAYADTRVSAAADDRDTAWLLFEYAKDFAKAIGTDIELLRSINANLRGEHS